MTEHTCAECAAPLKPEGLKGWKCLDCGTTIIIEPVLTATDILERKAPIPDHLVQAATILDAGGKHLRSRAETYDAPSGERSMQKAVDMFNILKGDDYFTTELGWLFMATLKMVRSQQGDFKLDNYEDMAAYCALAGEQAAQDRD